MTLSPNHIRPVFWARIVTLILAAIIAVVTLVPSPPGGVPGSDKLHHALAFACLAFPLSFARPRWVLWVVLGAIAFGAVIEVTQPAFGRMAEWADLWADGIGACVGAALGAGLSRFMRLMRA
ncbi:VanZ family protein [Jannaschia sp. CCS1]|uniref:VanZ family protein n=1 Tax=Jannaschia sp. (strain CCS1) TaxID=290400 RepID=UPI000053CFC6|nr:VanZ family protein [Jannaschia sp. CCS1]ABD53688.1 VanZ like protein [Jannaschia sp. CCS1]